jgi:hypothetical protein
MIIAGAIIIVVGGLTAIVGGIVVLSLLNCKRTKSSNQPLRLKKAKTHLRSNPSTISDYCCNNILLIM